MEQRYIIGFDPSSEAVKALHSLRTVEGTSFYREHRSYRFINAMKTDLAPKTAERLRKIPGIAYVEEDIEFFASTDMIDEVPFGIKRLNADWLHSQEIRGKDVKVAVLDTGMYLDHVDLAPNYREGIDLIDYDEEPLDGNGHGTHVAGIIAAALNDRGIVGIAPEANLYIIKVLDQNGRGVLSDVLEGLEWAIDHEVHIVNMSFGTTSFSQSLNDLCQIALNAGLTLVAAAGNRSGGAVEYPAAFTSVIAVSATDHDDQTASFNSIGPEVEVCAPGVKIYSTWPLDSYTFLSGTSMASPHVAGLAALIKEIFPDSDSAFIRDKLRDISKDLGNPGRDNQYGFGIPDGYILKPLKGDFNADGIVDVHDLLIFANTFNTKCGDADFDPRMDFNGDCIIDVQDYLQLAKYFGSKKP